MNGGIAYVLDEKGDFASRRCNLAGVDLEPVLEPEDAGLLRSVILKHANATGSRKAQEVLRNFA
jgi:glutamate synthase domain-containing protein 3